MEVWGLGDVPWLAIIQNYFIKRTLTVILKAEFVIGYANRTDAYIANICRVLCVSVHVGGVNQ